MTTVRQFVEEIYFPHVESSLSPSSVSGYRKLYRSYGHYLDNLTFAAPVHECQKALRDLCAANPHLKKISIIHAKNFFSGIFALALRLGYSDANANPWKTVKCPTAPESNETHAYSVAEITTMLKVLPMPYELIVLFFACTGLRKSECRGVQWGDIDLETNTLSVERALWQNTVKTTKNKSSRAPIPIVPTLAERLAAYKKTVKHGPKDSLFANRKQGAMDLDIAARRFIIPAIEAAGVTWHGFHAFRRGLATNLHAQGVPDKEIQRILRHGDVATTQKAYVKVLPESTRAAMAAVNFGQH